MSKWLDDMIALPAFTNSKDFEYQCRRNMLTLEADRIADEFAGEPPLKADVVEYEKWANKRERKYFRTMEMLWKQKYGGA